MWTKSIVSEDQENTWGHRNRECGSQEDDNWWWAIIKASNVSSNQASAEAWLSVFYFYVSKILQNNSEEISQLHK